VNKGGFSRTTHIHIFSITRTRVPFVIFENWHLLVIESEWTLLVGFANLKCAQVSSIVNEST